jgi:hypothetical protein
MFLECQCATAHVAAMDLIDVRQSAVLNAPLGQPAPNRGPVDLLAEATRLKFSVEEIAELKRLYELCDQMPNTKMPQKAD